MFVDRLSVTIELTIGTTTVTVPAGNIKRFALRLRPWGFSAEAEWWLVSLASQSEDSLFSSFVGRDLLTVAITVKRAFDEVAEDATTVTLRGVVTEKSVIERAFSDVADKPVLQRNYAISFADRGAVFWRQHYPNALYVDKTLKALIDDNLPEGVIVAHDWASSDAVHPVLSLGLGGAENHASFYDFLHWLFSKTNSALYYNVATNAYAILDAKPETVATPIQREEVASLEARFGETRRSTVTVMNSDANSATKKDILNSLGVQGVRRDYMVRSPIARDLDTRVTLETSRAAQAEPEAYVTLRSYPAVAFIPQMHVTFGADFGSNIYQNGKTYRVISSDIRASAVSQVASDGDQETSNAYNLDYEIGMELALDLAFRSPPFVAPSWPFYVEGKVLSEVGSEVEGTYQSYQDAATSLDFYKVKIPLWADQKVIVSYLPTLLSGHFYFPIYKDARVLIALNFDTAQICEFLDWRPGARLPLESQGNQILVGKGDANETSIVHAYEDAKPALTILRTSSTDEQTIKVSEGTIRFETKDTG